MKKIKKILALALVAISLSAVTLPALAVNLFDATVAVPAGQTLNLRATPSSSGTILYTPSSGTLLTVDSDLTNPTWIKVTSYSQTCYAMRKFIDTSTVDNPFFLFGSSNLAQSSTVKAAVFNLQWALKRVGPVDPGPIDGIFGSQTKEAVEQFQAIKGLEDIDGIVGPATRQKLAEALILAN